jgi:hypothetical protein
MRRDNSGLVASHPFARKKAKGWGTECCGDLREMRGYFHAPSKRRVRINCPR